MEKGGGETSFIKAPLAPERNSVKCMKNILDYSKTSIIWVSVFNVKFPPNPYHFSFFYIFF